MNLKTTFLLIILLGAGIGAWFWFNHRQVEETASLTTTFLEESLDVGHITRIEVQRGKEPRFILERNGEEWSLPGKWPVREVELKNWLEVLTGLRSRFAALPLRKDREGMKKFGLNDNPLTIIITQDHQTHTLVFGEEPAERNRFTRATFLRLDDQSEVVRLGSGILNMLDRTQDYFMQRRLFAVERVAKEDDSREKIEQLAASALEVETPDSKFKLIHQNKEEEWILQEVDKKNGAAWKQIAKEDRVEPTRLKALLTGVPDLWAEKFVDRAGKKLTDFGLDPPEYIVTVTRAGGAQSKILIGKVSDKKVKLVNKPAPPPQFGPPMKPPPQMVTVEYRFAKLENNDQVFEVKVDKIEDIAVAPEMLRDPQLARFKVSDVHRLEIRQGGQDMVLVRRKGDRDHWYFEKPVQQDAESKPVEEILDKLTNLQVNAKEILDQADLKAIGLDIPQARITLALEEKKDDKKKTRTITFDLGRRDKEANKLYVRVMPWPRVNQVGEDLWKLVQRPVLAYRSRRILDFKDNSLTKITIQRTEERFSFEKRENDWKMISPIQADVDPAKLTGLVHALENLEGVEFVSDQPPTKDLEQTYGLAKPALTVQLYSRERPTTPQTLIIGKQRAGTQDAFARLDQGPVFALKKDLREDLDRPSLVYRPLQLWQIDPDTITAMTVHKNSSEYQIKKEGLRWKIHGPFDAEALDLEVEEMAAALARLKAERFASHHVKDPALFGLDKPTLKVQIVTGDGKQRALEIGKNVDNDTGQFFARLSDQDAVVVLGEKTIAPLNHTALELLDRKLLSLDPAAIERIHVQGTASFTLEPIKNQWQVVNSPAPTFLADDAAVKSMLSSLTILRAEKYVAFGKKIDWAQYGLEKPATTVRVIPKRGDDDKSKKAPDHLLEIGKENSGGARFARIDKKDAVMILDRQTSETLSSTYLDFLDPLVLKYDADALIGVHRHMKGEDLEVNKQEDQWRMLKPSPRDADNLTMGDLLEKTFRLQAVRIAAYPVKDLQPFGLDQPLAIVTLQLESAGAVKKHVIKVGGRAGNSSHKETEQRYALIDDRPIVAVLSAELSRHLTASSLYFADRNLVSISGIDQALMQRGPRQVTFALVDASWKMIAPLKSDAEETALEELIRSVQRLRADEIIADKGADLKKYGLDTPVLQWRFMSGDSEKMHLLVGATEKDQPLARRYAKLGDKAEIFLLSAKLTAKVAEEYRKRKPWAPLDAAQVERVIFTSPEKSFTLQKMTSGWSVLGEPDLVVNAKLVTDTLDALASLQALRFVVDTKADLQLYGLQSPSKIEVQTPSGKRELWLGRAEGDTQRLYATVSGSDAVFILAEADRQRIARPLAAFVESKMKP